MACKARWKMPSPRLLSVAAFTLQVAGRGDAGNEERRHLKSLFFKVLLAPPFSFAHHTLHPGHKTGFAWIAQHVQVGLRHDVTDAFREIGTQIHGHLT